MFVSARCQRRVVSIRHDKGAPEMATLELVTLECHRKHDLINKDEPQITVDGITVWNGVMGKGRRRPAPRQRPFQRPRRGNAAGSQQRQAQADRRRGHGQGKRQSGVGELQDLRHLVRAGLQGGVSPGSLAPPVMLGN